MAHCVPCLIFTRHANGMLIIVTAQRSMASVILLVSSPLSFPPPPFPLPAVRPLDAPAMRKSFCNEYIVCISFSQAPDDQCNAGWALMMFQLGQSSHLINGKKVSLLPLDRKGKLQMKTKDFLSRYLSLGRSVSFVALAFLSICHRKQLLAGENLAGTHWFGFPPHSIYSIIQWSQLKWQLCVTVYLFVSIISPSLRAKRRSNSFRSIAPRCF